MSPKKAFSNDNLFSLSTYQYHIADYLLVERFSFCNYLQILDAFNSRLIITFLTIQIIFEYSFVYYNLICYTF